MGRRRALYHVSNIVRPVVKPLDAVRDRLAPEPKQFLQDNFADTYWSLRAAMAAIAFAFPVLIPLAGYVGYGIPWQDSLSAYYHASVGGESEAPMRVWFFGGLCATAICLVAYKGYSTRENWLLNFAGLSAICVAALPMPWNGGVTSSPVSFHYIAAVLLFVILAWVSIGCSRQTLKEADDDIRLVFEPLYDLIGLVMFTVPIAAWIWTWIIGHKSAHVFWMEFIAIWAFAWFWVLKNAELRTTIQRLGHKSLEKAAVSGDLDPPAKTLGGLSADSLGAAGRGSPEMLRGHFLSRQCSSWNLTKQHCRVCDNSGGRS